MSLPREVGSSLLSIAACGQASCNYLVHLHNRAPTSLWAAICSFVCRVSTSFRDGLIGCAQSQSLRVSGSVAHPAIETAIKSSIAISLHVMSDLR
jgi:hypothetical protein